MKLVLRGLGDVDTVEHDPAARSGVETEDRPSERRLPATRLADEADGLASRDRERDTVDSLDVPDVAIENDAARDLEPDAEVVDLDQGLVHHLTHVESDQLAAAPRIRLDRVEAGGRMPRFELLEERQLGRRSGSCRNRHRGANGHDAGAFSMLRGLPGMGFNGADRRVSRRGTLSSSPSVYGCRGCPKI